MPAIRLVETRRGCAICEAEPRYDVLLNGESYAQLYFNLRGYVGTLPTPTGRLSIGECGIGTYRRVVAQLNKEWADCVHCGPEERDQT